MARQLVICCDGTWSTPDQVQDGVPTPTNVVRIFHALQETPDQLRYYHPGVGTGRGLLDRLGGGGLGTGLAENVKSAYAWLSRTWRAGDEVSLFGFSRGAYTVRSLVGMIAACGLARFADEDDVADCWAEIDRLYDTVYRPPDPSPGAVRPTPPHPTVPIRFLGVWDTVGALGVPESLGPLRLLDLDARHRFHDTRLSPLVRHARHALALDEVRGPFTPTLWTWPADTSAGVDDVEHRTVRQVWFPGNHGDVGGGHRQTGLSDGALRWMIDEAAACTGLAFRERMVEQVRPDPCDVLHDDCTGIFRHLGPTPRAVPLIAKESLEDALHPSVLDRQARPPIATGEYRPSRVLEPGERAGCPVYAGRPWNATGLWLEPGRYALTAAGAWLDGRRSLGPEGAREGRVPLPAAINLAGSILGRWQEWYRRVGDDPDAILFGAPRVDEVPWMALVGVVAAQDVDPAGAQRPYRPFRIGRGTSLVVAADRPGYLYAFANDGWGFYGDNRGSVTLTVTRQASADSPSAG